MVSVPHANLISYRVRFALCLDVFTRATLVVQALSWRERYSPEIASACQIQLVRLQ